MEIGIRLHDTAGSNLEEHLCNAKEQGFSCVHIAMSKVVPGFKMADAPELLTDALADEGRGVLEKYDLTDDFADTPDYELFYTELTGTVQILLEDGIQ